MPTKAQGRRAQRQKGRYADRFNITARNKARRAAARLKRANSEKALNRKIARDFNNKSKGIPRPRKKPKGITSSDEAVVALITPTALS